MLGHKRRTRGFTLIELLVVIAIIALLVAILLPSLSKAKDMARGVICSVNTRNIAQALHMYASDYDEALPYAVQGPAGQTPDGERYVQWWAWIGVYGDYYPYDPNCFEDSGWTCPFAGPQIPQPQWHAYDRWSSHYALNLYMSSVLQDSGWSQGRLPVKISNAGCAETVLVGDGALGYYTAGYYFGGTIWQYIEGEGQLKVPWPIDDVTGELGESHLGMVTLGSVDGHVEMYRGMWGEDVMYRRFRRADMSE